MDMNEIFPFQIKNFMYDVMMHTVPEIFKVPAIQKYVETSEESFRFAKDALIKQDYFDALWLYNRAIACADSKKLASKGYAKRSAVFLELKLYAECLQNIKWARENGYPKEKLPKLKEREAKCKKMMKEPKEKEENLWDFFKLSYPANEKIPWLVNRVEMRWTEKSGRGIYAKEDLKAGDVICIEEPVINYAHEDNTYMRCYNCFKTNAMNLIPCDETGSMMFCSTACKENFNAKVKDFAEMLCADVKMLSDIYEVFGSVNRVSDFIDRVDPKNDLKMTIFDYDWSNQEDPLYNRNKMMCLLSLSTNDRKVMHKFVIGKYVSEKAAHHLLTIYKHNFQTVRYNNGDSKSARIGWCIPLFASLINHSCVRNAVPILVDNKLVTIIQKPVKAGEQIYFCYPSEDKMFTQFVLNSFKAFNDFECECEFCVNKIERKSEDLEALLEPFKNESNPAYDRDYVKVKDYLKEAWEILSNNPTTVKGYSPHMLQTVKVLEAIAFQIAYPFYPPEPELL